MKLNDLPVRDALPPNVEVTTWSFANLCEQPFRLKLDHYQRPYVWNRAKIEQLLDDLAEFTGRADEDAYYVGSILLHRDEKQQALFVIDGQQRLSSLAVLYHAFFERLPSGLDFHYRSPVSAVNLHEAKTVIAEARSLGFDETIFDRLQFTVITVASEDLAFTFFDTQNNRGVPLKATDLLKAFHLRAVNDCDSRQTASLQTQCARHWERVQMSGAQENGKRVDFAPALFHEFLWRARNWSGQKHIDWEDHDGILESFQKRSLETATIDSLPLYASPGNQFASQLRLQGSGDLKLELAPVQIGSNAANLPFSLRQPIHRGVGFFLYAQKYAAILDALFHQEPAHADVRAVREFYGQVVAANSRYLRELFDLALLMYVDRFEHVRLLEFAQRLEFVLGALRLEKEYVFKEATPKYLREADHNLIDVIAGAYRPDEVMDFLESELANSKGYDETYAGRVEAGKGVRGRYLAAMKKYYGSETLRLKIPGNISALILSDRKGE
jgi:hypothetical protein